MSIGPSRPTLLVLACVLLTGCSAPLDLDGVHVEVGKPSYPEGWSSWSAEPGARNVTGPTLLQLHGTSPLRVRFTDTAFRGADDPRWSVPIDGNLVMGWGYDERSFRWTSAANVTVPLDEAHASAVVNYRILRVDEPLPAQEYRADYVVEHVDARP